MKKVFKLLSLSMLVFFILSGCNSKDAKEDVFKFKDSYVGDNSVIGSIVNKLQAKEHFKDFELETNNKTYGIILNYDWPDSKQNYKETVIYNATYLFTLVQNADWVTFNIDNQEYQITKRNLQNWYGEDLSHFQNEAELKTLIQTNLNDEDKVNQLFK